MNYSIHIATMLPFMHACRIKEHLGSGQFGVVYRGMWRRGAGKESEADEITEVAVKSMQGGAGEEDRVKFLQEAAIMGQFKHPYILQILGYMTGDTVSDPVSCTSVFTMVRTCHVNLYS